ncbi:hypothetical protein EDB19DRAFT_871563 [Suillus lakei]|nr:hypothetical protein EDB19DRAFT_871563 [Suillus lakei]
MSEIAVNVVYTEPKLKTTLDLMGSMTIEEAKNRRKDAILEQVQALKGAPPLAPSQAHAATSDFVPTSTLQDLDRQPITIVVCPEPATSPFLELLGGQAADLVGASLVREELEDKLKDNKKAKKQKEFDSDMVSALRESMAEMEDRIIEVKTDLTERNDIMRADFEAEKVCTAALRADLHISKERINVLEKDAQALRHRVILDTCRLELARLCGFGNWASWKRASEEQGFKLFDNAESCLSSLAPGATTEEQRRNSYWKALGGQHAALRMVLHGSNIRHEGDVAAHSSTTEEASHSVLSMADGKDRRNMTTIFEAVYSQRLSL